jgi:hypothetical protein
VRAAPAARAGLCDEMQIAVHEVSAAIEEGRPQCMHSPTRRHCNSRNSRTAVAGNRRVLARPRVVQTINRRIVVTHSASRIARRAAAGFLAASALVASTASFAASPAFESRMSAFITSINGDSSYKRIPLQNSADKEWFYDRTEALFQKKITKEQFVSEGAAKFPGYESSFTTVADFMTRQ